MGDGSPSPAEESAGAGGAIIEVASQRVTRLGGVLARRRPRPPRLAVESSKCPNRTPAIGTAMAPVSKNFGPQNCGAVPRTSLQDQGAARMIEDYDDFQRVLIFEQSVNDRRGPRSWPQIGAAAMWLLLRASRTCRRTRETIVPRIRLDALPETAR